jgi:hypothetical protein
MPVSAKEQGAKQQNAPHAINAAPTRGFRRQAADVSRFR